MAAALLYIHSHIYLIRGAAPYVIDWENAVDGIAVRSWFLFYIFRTDDFKKKSITVSRFPIAFCW